MDDFENFFLFRIQPMRIQISESCNEALKGTDFQTEFRGQIELKV